MNTVFAYFGSISCINAYIFKGILGHKNPVPSYDFVKKTPAARQQIPNKHHWAEKR
jgi:hypothetical protein